MHLLLNNFPLLILDCKLYRDEAYSQPPPTPYTPSAIMQPPTPMDTSGEVLADDAAQLSSSVCCLCFSLQNIIIIIIIFKLYTCLVYCILALVNTSALVLVIHLLKYIVNLLHSMI